MERDADLEALVDPFAILRLLLPRPPIWLGDVVKGFATELVLFVVVIIIIINEKILKIFYY
jgi:hypothetical protein